MSVAEAVPLVVVALLLLSANGVEPDRAEIVFEGAHETETIDGALVVSGGTVTVPANATVAGPLYVTGGDVTILGAVDGNVRVLAGNLSVADGARITGELETISGETVVAAGAQVGSQSRLDVTPRRRSLAERLGFLLAQALVLGVAGALLARRAPALLETVGDSITGHAVVSGVVGSIAATTLLVLFVYMAFTLVLLPLSVAGLLAELLVVLYAYVVYGYLIGRRLPIDRVDLATGVGVGVFVLVMTGLGRVPVLGAVGQIGLVAVGFGAVLITYFGLQRFEPATLPGEA